MTNSYRPAAFSFGDAKERIAEGRAQIAAAANGEMTIDAGDLADGGTPAVCALLAWRRAAKERGMHLQINSVPPRLHKLIQVYQLEKILPHVELAAAESAR